MVSISFRIRIIFLSIFAITSARYTGISTIGFDTGHLQQRHLNPLLQSYLSFFPLIYLSVCTGNGEGYPLSNIYRMISDPLEILSDHQKIRCLLSIAGIFIYQLNQFILNRNK